MSTFKQKISQFLTLHFPVMMSKRRYLESIGRSADLSEPKAMTEKLMYLKLNKYWNNRLVARCADKYAVREFIEEKGCNEILTPIYGSWSNALDIDWNSLPDKFVLKCNHGSGYNIVVTDKQAANKDDILSQLDAWMNERYGVITAENGIYDLIPRRIIAEKFIETADGLPPKDYKFFCSFGKVVLLFVASDRIEGQTKFDYYYPDWTHIPVKNYFPNNGPIERPTHLDEMIRYAEKLSVDFPIVRVDLYNEADQIYFGELTFTHFGCLNGFEPDSYDFEFGKLFPDAKELKAWTRNK